MYVPLVLTHLSPFMMIRFSGMTRRWSRDMQKDATGKLETAQVFDVADECEAIMTVDEEFNEEIEDAELMQRLANLRNWTEQV